MNQFALQAPRTVRHAQRGFGLVELMVSLVLGLVLIGGVLNIFLSNQQAFRSNEGLARLQENARIVFELMARDLREAGGNQCGAKLVANVVNGATADWTTNWSEGSIRGYDSTQLSTAVVPVGTANTDRVTNTAAITVRLADPERAVQVVNHNATAASFELSTVDHGFEEGDFVMVCDGASAAIMQITDASSGTNDTVIHNTGVSGVAPGNCSKGLGYPTDCSGAVGNAKTFASGGIMAQLEPTFWYIGNNDRGGRSLFRRNRIASEEIAEGVTNMELAYLLRDEATGNLDSNWVAASAITDWTETAAKQVVAVRVALDLESTNQPGTDGQPLRRSLVHVVNLRNRSL